jgi:DNA-binding NarL/FixJ family response regulator
MASLVIPSLTMVIVTEHYLVWLGLQKLFESRAPQIDVLPHRTIVSEALRMEKPPDLVILDTETIRDPTSSIRQIRESASSSKIVLLSGLEDKECLCEALKCGVESVILKIQPPEVVLAAIDALYCPANSQAPIGSTRILDGGTFIKTEMKTSPLTWPDELTAREREIVALVGQGLSNKDIAYQLSISDSTVRHHLTSIFGKVGVTSRQKLLIHTHHVSKPQSTKRV